MELIRQLIFGIHFTYQIVIRYIADQVISRWKYRP